MTSARARGPGGPAATAWTSSAAGRTPAPPRPTPGRGAAHVGRRAGAHGRQQRHRLGGAHAQGARHLVAIADRVGVPRVVLSAVAPEDGLGPEVADLNEALTGLAAEQGWQFVDPMTTVRGPDGRLPRGHQPRRRPPDRGGLGGHRHGPARRRRRPRRGCRTRGADWLTCPHPTEPATALPPGRDGTAPPGWPDAVRPPGAPRLGAHRDQLVVRPGAAGVPRARGAAALPGAAGPLRRRPRGRRARGGTGRAGARCAWSSPTSCRPRPWRPPWPPTSARVPAWPRPPAGSRWWAARCAGSAGHPGCDRSPTMVRGYHRAVSLLRSLTGPADLRALAPDQLPALAAEIRDALVTSVAKTGGHLGPNLGAVELTIAIHRVFDSPHEPVVFDTGHQSYVHKLLTGGSRASPACGSAGACRATRRGPRASTTGSRTATPPPRCPTPTAWPRPSPSAATSGPWSRSSATARSPAAWPGRR